MYPFSESLQQKSKIRKQPSEISPESKKLQFLVRFETMELFLKNNQEISFCSKPYQDFCMVLVWPSGKKVDEESKKLVKMRY